MGKLRRILWVGAFSIAAQFGYSAVSINEVMPCNISTYMDETNTYNFLGYVEFYNSGSSSVDLNGYKLVHEKRTSKGVYSPKWTWTITESIVVPANGYKLIFFDESTISGHSPYKLDSDGGNLFLYNATDTQVSTLTFPPMQVHVAYGPGGYMEPTPLAKNSVGFANLTDKRVAKPTFSGVTPGLVSASGSLTISTTTAGATIYYTTDGTEPNTSSTKYTSAIKLSSNKVIRAKAYADGYLSSEITTGSFIFSDTKHSSCNGFTLPIISLAMDDKWMNDDTYGICVKGTNGAAITSSCLGTGTANFMQDWKRPVSFEYIVDGAQVISHEAEVAVMGGCSRGYDVKSFKLKAGKKLGSGNEVLNYTFFADKANNECKSIHIRNGGNAFDPQWVRCRDGYMTSLAKMMAVDYQAYQPVAYYINGEYKGLMGLRERSNVDFVEANYGIDEENLDVLKLTNVNKVEATSGDASVYNAMISFCESASPSAANYYETMASYIDMNEYIDYNIYEHFIVNTDWPGNNCKLWREKDNGRFRWIIFDSDFGLGLYDSYASNYCDVTMNSIEWCTGTGSKVNWANGTKSGTSYVFDSESAWKTTLFKHLMQNEVFKEKFLNRNLIHLGTTFTNDRVQAVWDSVLALVKDEYCASFDYNNDLSSLSKANSMIEFAKNRPSYMYSYLQSYYGLGDLIALDFSANVEGVHFMMNDELVNASSFSGKYFSGKQLKLEAIAPVGYKFSHWDLGDGTVSTSLLSGTSLWKYYYPATGFSNTNWAATSFDEEKWSEGYGKFGYASSNTSYNTVLDYGSDNSNKPITAYFRNTFNLSSLSGLQYLNFNIIYDDAFIIYINGKEVKRANISGDAVYSTLADDYKNDEELSFKLTASELSEVLVSGINTIAVEIHQNSASSSDLTFKMTASAAYEGGTVEGLTEPILITTLTEDKTIKANFEKLTSCPTIDLLISEVGPSNDSTTSIVDEYGKHPDWFEIYNNGKDTINLAGLYLTDNQAKPMKSQIPYGYNETKLAPGAHFVLWADNKPYRGFNHVDFKLSNSVEESTIYIYNGCDLDNYVDVAIYSPLGQNESYGREDDNSDTWVVYKPACDSTTNEEVIYLPTPGEANGSLSLKCTKESSTDEVLSVVDERFVQFYPNPVEDVLNVIVGDGENRSLVSVFDHLGRKWTQATMNGNFTINVESWPSGVYNLNVVVEGVGYNRLFIKK